MYAVIANGGKQYRVAIGDRLKVEKLIAEQGETIALDQVLMITNDDGVRVGTPTIEGSSVNAQVIGHGRGKKIRVFKMKRRKNYRRTQGHRQDYTELEITSIDGVSNESAAPAKSKNEPVTPVTVESESASDDLTRINGIGPVIVEKLNGLNITTFAQIAAFTPAQIEEISGHLSFKGRIEREQWVDQAKTLMAEE